MASVTTTQLVELGLLAWALGFGVLMLVVCLCLIKPSWRFSLRGFLITTILLAMAMGLLVFLVKTILHERIVGTVPNTPASLSYL